MFPKRAIISSIIYLLPCILIYAFLYTLGKYNYLLFHATAEGFAIAISTCIFFFAWNSQSVVQNSFILFLGISFLFVGITDFIHALAYQGMHILPDSSANSATQLWVAARYIQCISLLISSIFLHRKINGIFVFGLFGLLFILVQLTIFHWDFFPDCFLEGEGLTPFKVFSEYVIIVLLLLSIGVIIKHKKSFDPNVFTILIASIGVAILSEFCFTLYYQPYDFFNFTGHILKFFSYYLIYRAIIVNGLEQPYRILFHNLLKREEDLRKERDQLHEALAQIKTLRGLIPICSVCKKIRYDHGYWNQLETYIHEHSEAEFSHGICPDCAKKLYPQYTKKLKP